MSSTIHLLVTGGAGFIGSNFIRAWIAAGPSSTVINLDALTYAGNPASLNDVAEAHAAERYFFAHGDIADAAMVESVLQGRHSGGRKPTHLINFAAESHVDRSILDATDFIRTNVAGTQNLLDAARRHGLKRFLHVSTDEVYGSLGPADPPFSEESPLEPTSPYAASKASADLLVQAAHRTHGLDTVITRCSNNYGPCQYPEKLIPLMILRALEEKPLPVYGDGLNVRDWIHVRDHVDALITVLRHGRAGDVYNIGGGNEYPNINIVKGILDILGRSHSLIDFVADRPGHDRRYAINGGKIERTLGWKPTVGFERGLTETIQWYRSNEAWWRELLDEDYRSYYKKQYEDRSR